MSRYVISNGYRLVIPYLHTSKLTVKGNANGMSISEVSFRACLKLIAICHHRPFTDGVLCFVQLVQLEYPTQSMAMIENAVSGGRVQCNGKPVHSLHEPLHTDDVLCYTQHRHEPEVSQ